MGRLDIDFRVADVYGLVWCNAEVGECFLDHVRCRFAADLRLFADDLVKEVREIVGSQVLYGRIGLIRYDGDLDTLFTEAADHGVDAVILSGLNGAVSRIIRFIEVLDTADLLQVDLRRDLVARLTDGFEFIIGRKSLLDG